MVRWKSISDQVSYLDLELPTRSGKLVKCRVVNVYGPHKNLALEIPQLLVNFYGQVRDALDVPSNVETFMLGDFKSKLGRLTNSDRDFGFSSFMGNFGMGTKNEMGEHLLNFLSENDLFATNTVILHVIQQRTLVGERTGVLVVIARRPFQFILKLTSFCVGVDRSHC